MRPANTQISLGTFEHPKIAEIILKLEQNDLCAQRILRSAWAQPYKSLRRPREETLRYPLSAQ